jgi:CRP-like cAMP-binding protein
VEEATLPKSYSGDMRDLHVATRGSPLLQRCAKGMGRPSVTKPARADMARRLGGSDVANRILLALPAASWERVKANLKLVDLPYRKVIFAAGAPVEHLYFVNRGLVLLFKRMEDGRSVEIGAVGIEGIVGLYSLYGIESALWDSIIQIEGDAFRIDRQWLLGEMRRNDELREFLQRCHYIAISRLAQIAACNRLHSLRQRCCLWLLIAYDGARSDTFAVTHEFLAMMLGVQRVRLSIMAKSLQMSGIIQYTRGRITIVDRSALERAACECYRTIHTQFDQFFGPSDQFK